MPWHLLGFPSIQVGTLQAVLERAGVPSRGHSFHLELLRFLREKGLERMDIDAFGAVGSTWATLGVGDWVFAVPGVREPSKTRDAAYFELCRRKGVPTKLLRTLKKVKEHVPEFLGRCAEEVLRQNPPVVGFTLAFSQTLASVALARELKRRRPGLKIVFGGSSCQGPMGRGLIEAFDVIDVVVRGEAEGLLVELMGALAAGESLPELPGLCARVDGRVVELPGQGATVPMDQVPTPDYAEYFERLEHSGLAHEILPQVLFESSRGCWWGMKHHCTFCGINGEDMAYRSKSPERVLEDIAVLSKRHGMLDFSAVDSILDLKYLKSVVPTLLERGDDFSFFYETKANLSEEQLDALHRAGVTAITPGIESLSTPVLQHMKKGVTALQNIRLLKFCAQRGIRVAWNLLYGFPGEDEAEYARMARLAPLLVHLPAPDLGRLQMYRFSPYFERPAEYGLEVGEPEEHYGLLYDASPEVLTGLAVSFEYEHEDGRDPETYVDPLRREVNRWQSDACRNRGTLTYRKGPGFLVITDTRTTREFARYTLGTWESEAYLAIEQGAKEPAILRALEASGAPVPSVEELRELLDDLVEAGLAYEEEGAYLSLALPGARGLTRPAPARRSPAPTA